MREFLKNNRISTALCGAAFSYWIVYCLFSLDLKFFTRTSYSFRMIFLVFLIVGAWLLGKWIKLAVVLKIPFPRALLSSFLLNMIIHTALFIVLYPGCWAWDDILVLRFAKDIGLYGWQHIMSSIYMILCLYFIPSAAGAVFVQITLISFFSAWIVCAIEEIFLDMRASATGKILIRLPFLMPPVLYHNFLMMRNVMCAYLELAMLIMMLRCIHKKRCRVQEYLQISLILVIVASWRSENIYYLILMPVFLFLLCEKGRMRLIKALISMAVIVTSLFIGQLNEKVTAQSSDYSVVGTLGPAVEVTKIALNNPEKYSGELDIISEVLDPQVVKNNMDSSGINLSFVDGFIKNYTHEQYSEYLRCIVRMAVENPVPVLKERMTVFLNSSGIDIKSRKFIRNSYLSDSILLETNQAYRDESGFSSITDEHSYFPKLKENVLLFLGCHKGSVFYVNEFFYVFWNLIPPIIILVCALFLAWKRKKYSVLFCITAVLIKVPLIFMTAPGWFLMYYFSDFLGGYIVLNTFLITKLKNRTAKLQLCP